MSMKSVYENVIEQMRASGEVWECMMSKRICFSDAFSTKNQDDACEFIRSMCSHLKGEIIVEAMTDQIDVVQNGRRIATYMII